MAAVNISVTVSSISSLNIVPARLLLVSAVCASISSPVASAAITRVVAARIGSVSSVLARRLGAQEVSVLIESYSGIAAAPAALPPGIEASACNIVVLEAVNRIVIAECNC